MRPHRGAAVLTLGILGVVFIPLGLILGAIAWVMGNTELKDMEAGRADPSGRSMITAGRILGIVSCCLALLVIYVSVTAGIITTQLWSSYFGATLDKLGDQGETGLNVDISKADLDEARRSPLDEREKALEKQKKPAQKSKTSGAATKKPAGATKASASEVEPKPSGAKGKGGG